MTRPVRRAIHTDLVEDAEKDLEWSAYANLFPLMSPEELQGLTASITAHGLREPIVLDPTGRILDGRNRYLACRLAGVAPRFRDWKGTDEEALTWVIDTNLHRRHLSESQRAMLAARLANVTHGGNRRSQPAQVPHERISQAQAADTFGISERTVRDAKLVLEHGPDELRDDVEGGLLAARVAAELIRAAGKDRSLAAEYYRLRRTSKSQEWYTPQHIIDLVLEVLDGEIDLDPASNSHDDPWVPARMHYTKEDDGLALPWKGRVFLNPPFDRSPGAWVEKLHHSYINGEISQAIALLPARTNTDWIQVLAGYPRCFIRGRLRFSDGPGEAQFPSLVVYLGVDFERFGAAFSRVGEVYVHWASSSQDKKAVAS